MYKPDELDRKAIDAIGEFCLDVVYRDIAQRMGIDEESTVPDDQHDLRVEENRDELLQDMEAINETDIQSSDFVTLYLLVVRMTVAVKNKQTSMKSYRECIAFMRKVLSDKALTKIEHVIAMSGVDDGARTETNPGKHNSGSDSGCTVEGPRRSQDGTADTGTG